MRRLLLMSALMLLTLQSQGQEKNTAALQTASMQLDAALQARDTTLLNSLLHTKVSYVHSNGWVENKQELKANLYNGKLTYSQIQTQDESRELSIAGNAGVVRCKAHISVLLDNKPVELDLAILQFWIFEKGNWLLIGRQSTKVERH